MNSRANQKRPKESSPLSYSIWPFRPMDEAKRGVTAPGPPQNNFYCPKKLPASSHKFVVSSMNSPQSNKISIRGSGWNSSNIKAPLKLVAISQEIGKLNTLKPPDNLNRPLTTNCIPKITKINETKIHRPSSRHKIPPKSLDLYLPPSSCTPPHEITTKNIFDKTWSMHSKEPEINEPQYSDRTNVGSQAFKHSWDEGVTRPKTQNEKSRRMRLLATQEKVQPLIGNDVLQKSAKLHGIPIILNRDENYSRRILSAHVKEENATKSFKSVKAAFQSSLDGEFLNLFTPK